MKVDEIIKTACSYIGTKEEPEFSNNVIFNTDFYGHEVYGDDYAWCVTFIYYVFKQCNANMLIPKTGFCVVLENYFKNKNAYYSKPQIGDICFMDFGKGRASHVGIVKEVLEDGVINIEGNTTVTNDDNGGNVLPRKRTSNIRGYGRPDYKSIS